MKCKIILVEIVIGEKTFESASQYALKKIFESALQYALKK